jgi:hypothetical protein
MILCNLCCFLLLRLFNDAFIIKATISDDGLTDKLKRIWKQVGMY